MKSFGYVNRGWPLIRHGQGYLIIIKMFFSLSNDSLPSFTSSAEEALPTLNPAVEDALLEFLRVEVSEYIISLHDRTLSIQSRV